MNRVLPIPCAPRTETTPTRPVSMTRSSCSVSVARSSVRPIAATPRTARGCTATVGERRYDRQFSVERDEGLRDGRNAAEPGPSPSRLVGCANHLLALPVVPEAPCLEHEGVPQRVSSGECVVVTVDSLEVSHWDSERTEALLLSDPILGHLQRLWGGVHRNARGQRAGEVDRNVLELVRHHVESGHEWAQSVTDRERRGNDGPDARRAGVVCRIEKAEVDTQPTARQPQHAAQLTASQHADAKWHSYPSTGRGSGVSSTAWVRRARKARTRSRISG